jgi:hypothetical protein
MQTLLLLIVLIFSLPSFAPVFSDEGAHPSYSMTDSAVGCTEDCLDAEDR